MLIQNSITGNKGMFYIESGNDRLAQMDFTLSPGRMIIIHTEVDEKLKGKNIGKQLVDHAAALAREQQLKIIAYCPFAKSVFEKKREEYLDVLG